MSTLVTSVFSSASHRLSISLSFVLFLEFWPVLSFGPYFFVLVHLICCKRWNLRYSPGQDNPLLCVVVLYVGECSEREQCCLLGSHPPCHHFLHFPQADWAISSADSEVDGFVYVLGPHGPLPMDSPMTLGVSPTTTNLTGFYSQRYWVFSSPLKPWVSRSVSLPSYSFQLTFWWMWDYPPSQSAPASPAWSTALLHVLSALAAHFHPCYLSQWMFLWLFSCQTSIQLVFLVVLVVSCF